MKNLTKYPNRPQVAEFKVIATVSGTCGTDIPLFGLGSGLGF